MKGKRLRRVVCSLSALVLAGFLGTGQSAEAAFNSPYVKAETVFDDTGMHQHWTIEEDFRFDRKNLHPPHPGTGGALLYLEADGRGPHRAVGGTLAARTVYP